MPEGGTQAGRASYGSKIIVTINGVTREFPGELQGLAESARQAGGQDRRQRSPGGRFRVVPPADQAQAKVLTLTCDLAPHLLDYQAIAALSGTETQMTVKQERDELEIAPETATGNTVAISTAFVPTFAGSSHPSNVPIGAALKIASAAFVISELDVPSDAAASVTRGSALDLLDVVLDRQGEDSDDDYHSGDDATLASAVAASRYSVVAPATDTGNFAVRVLDAPIIGNFQGGEPGTVIGGVITLELVGDDVPFERITALPVVS